MKRIFLVVCISVLFFNCSTESNSDNQVPEDQNFYALTVGNSWVYKNYKYNPQTELYDDTGVIDSLSIVSTEEILGNNYYKFRRWTTGNEEQITFCNPNGEHFEYLREFEGSLVNNDGIVKFTNNNFSLRIVSENNWGNIVEQLVEGETSLEVEAGTFNCINSERYAILQPSEEQSPGLDRFYYADGFGLIYDTSSFVSTNIPTIIRRLDSYNIN